MAAQIPSSIEEMVLGGGGPESASHINMLAQREYIEQAIRHAE